MGVLSATLITFLTAVLLPELNLFGEQDVFLRLLALMLLHSYGAYMSWTSHYSGWGDRMLWAVALLVHMLTYFFHWELYAIQWDPEKYAVLTEPQLDMMQFLVIVGIILIPSVLMFGGPTRAILRPYGELTDAGSA